VAQVTVAGRPVTLASAHLESHAGPTRRGEQMAFLLDRMEDYAPGAPALVGGDVNSNTHERDDPRPTDGARLANPQPYEPMFGVTAHRGYDTNACNVPGAPTQRTRPDGHPQPPFAKLDWYFARGLETWNCAVIPALGQDGGAISDHEAIAVTIR
jgi:endonuclease/exonuclease/phosphatase family metal-dependent hydrolase